MIVVDCGGFCNAGLAAVADMTIGLRFIFVVVEEGRAEVLAGDDALTVVVPFPPLLFNIILYIFVA